MEASGEEELKFEKNILVTGGSGFIGSHVVNRLVNNYPQYKIVNFDCMDYCSSKNNNKSIESKKNYKFVEGNILSADLLRYLLDEEKIDVIMHFAAQSHVDNSFGNSFEFTKTNVLGTHILLEAARLANIKLFVHVSTDEVYGEIANNLESASEEKVLEPTNPYAATKAAAEFIVKSYARSFNLPVIITRGNNVYGPHQFPEKIIPKFILRLLRNLPCCVHGTGTNTRNYIYVDDVATAFDVILHRGVPGNVYNIGTDVEISNIDVAKKLISIFGFEEEKYLQFVEDRNVNDRRYHINDSKIRELGWSPSVSFDEGVLLTVEWYKKNQNHWGMIEPALFPHPKSHTSFSDM